MKTVIEILVDVTAIGGWLHVKNNKLQAWLPEGCPPELVAEIKESQCALAKLVALNFLIIPGKIIGRTYAVYWVPDHAAKQSLVAAGAQVNSIYTAAEIHGLEQMFGERWTVETMWQAWEAS